MTRPKPISARRARDLQKFAKDVERELSWALMATDGGPAKMRPEIAARLQVRARKLSS